MGGIAGGERKKNGRFLELQLMGDGTGGDGCDGAISGTAGVLLGTAMGRWRR